MRMAPAFLAPVNLVSGNYFSVLGAEPLLGRTILPVGRRDAREPARSLS